LSWTLSPPPREFFCCSCLFPTRAQPFLLRTYASTASAAAAPFAALEFGASSEKANLVTSIFLLGYVFGPVLWGPFSEAYGRKPILVVSYGLFTLSILGQTLSRNMTTLIVTRFLSGLVACSPFAVGPGIIVDLWGPVSRSTASAVMVAVMFIGPVMGPISGGL